MRKKLSLLLVAFMAVAAFAVQQATKRAPATPNIVSWAVTSDNAPAVGTAFDVKNGDDAALKVAFGAMNSSKDDAEATNYTTSAANVSINFDGTDYAFGAYATTSATNGSSSSSLGANGESNANYMAITPKYDGQLVIVVQNQGNKTTYLFEDGHQKAATLIGNGSSNIAFSGEGDLKEVSGGESNYSGGILVDVKAGSLYTISVNGSKGRWMGLIYEYVVPLPTDIEVAPEGGADIAAALADATAGVSKVGNITINLAKGAAYTISAPIKAPASVTINGNGATIDAAGLTGNMIEMAVVESPTEWTEANVTISGVTVKGLKKALYYSACKNYYGNVNVDNCVVEQAADATTFDYTKGSTAVNFTVMNSTFYAPTATTKSFYSSQGGQKTTEYNDEAVQTFTFANNTMYNLATGKNFFSHRQSNQKWLTYNVQNNIFVNCGKSGQTIKGLNGGQSGKNPTWIIKGNAFTFNGMDTGANEETGDENETVEDTVEGAIQFKDAENGNFAVLYTYNKELTCGDTRWGIVPTYPINIAEGIEHGTVAPQVAEAQAGEEVTIDITPDYSWKLKNFTVTGVTSKEDIEATIAEDGASAKFTMPAEEVTVNAEFYFFQKYYITGQFSKWGLKEMAEMEYNEKTEACEYVLTVDEEESFAISDTLTIDENDFSFFNKNHRYSVALGVTEVEADNSYELGLNGAGEMLLKGTGKFLLSLKADQDKLMLTISKVYEDIALSVSAGEDISEAIAKEAEGKFVGGITLKLGAEQYTISKPIEPAGSLTIEGNGAVIDAAKLEGNFIQMAEVKAPTEWTEANVRVENITVKGLKNALFYSTCKNYYGNFTVDKCVVELAGDATTFDYTKGSTAVNFTMTNSTFYAPTATTKAFYSSQGGQKTTEYDGDAVQTFTFANNTMYNLAKSKNFFSHRQSNQKWLTYDVQNNIFVNCGKSGQTIKGMNGGQSGTNPTWIIKNNSFNFDGENTYLVDTSASESTGDSEEAVEDNVEGMVVFADAENGDFTLGDCVQKLFFIGDPRWNNTTFGATAKLYNYLEEPQKGSMKVSVLGEDTELTEYGQSADVNSGKTVIVEITPADGYLTKDVYLRRSPFGPVPPTPLKVNDNKYAFTMTTSLAFVCADFLTVLKNEWIGQIANQQWTGEAIEPSLVVVDANTGVQLEAGKHYEASYANNVDAGEATVTITGIEKNGYAGTATAKFNIIKIASTELAEGNFIYRTDDNVTATILWMSANEGATTFEIPAAIDGYQIVAIVDGALQSMNGLKEIILPKENFVWATDKAFYDTNIYLHPSKMPNVNVPLKYLEGYAAQLSTFTKSYKVKATVKQTAEKYWTFSTLTAVLLPDGLKANILKYKSDNEVEKVALGTQYVEAGQGVLLEGTQDTEYVITAVNEIPAAEAKNAANYEENLLIAVPAAFHFPAGEGYYILKGGQFVAIADSENAAVPANKAVLHIVTGTPAAVIAIAGGEATGINTLAIDAQEGNWYDLNGRKLEGKPSQKGIYILNGKKVVLK